MIHIFPRGSIWKKITGVALTLMLLSMTIGSAIQHMEASERLRDRYSNQSKATSDQFDVDSILKPTYRQVAGQYKQTGNRQDSVKDLIFPANSYSAFGGTALTSQVVGDRSEPTLVWEKGTDWIEWTVDVPASGLYNLTFDYYPMPGKRLPIERSLSIDGDAPFREAQRLYFYRIWADQGKPTQNNQGDDVRPSQVEKAAWVSAPLTDGNGLYAEPFQFSLSAGKHVIRMGFIQEPVSFDQIRLAPALETPDYAKVKSSYDASGFKPVSKVDIKVQAENNPVKSDPTVRMESNGDPLVEPASELKFRLNVFGDWRWRKGGQSAAWSFTVPEDGLYKIGLKVGEWWGNGLPSYRQIQIDGKSPFKELELYPFTYSRDWRIETLGKSANEPYLVHLTKGEHKLTMVAQIGPFQPIVESLTTDSKKLSDIIRRIIMVTGPTPDPNYEYELDKRIPGLLEDIQALAGNLGLQIDALRAISQEDTSMANSLLMMKNLFDRMVLKPDSIPRQLDDLNNSLTNLGTWLIDLQNQPLVMDYFLISAPDVKWPGVKSNIWEKMGSTLKNFFTSFRKDYTGIGSVYKGGSGGKGDDDVLDVWVGRGREWAEIMKEMIESDFTKKTGIRVNINTLPAGQLNSGSVNTLLLAASSGKAPDVATGVGEQLPLEFAIRDAAVDLSKLPGYDSVEKQFLSGAMVPFRYNEGVYALPETQDFNILIYRKDILKELGLSVPQTWDQVAEMIPVLQQNGMQFYYPPTNPQDRSPLGFATFLYQNKGEFYTADGKSSGLNTPEAYKAFKEWTELYTNYKFPIYADLFNRFRTGEMPIGLSGYWTYVLLSTAAPELAGRWGIAAAPGHAQANGEIDRTAGGQVQSVVIFKQSKKQQQAWEFLKWWTSKDVQAQFGRELEALLGVEARWNTANMEAFSQLPWPEEDLKALSEGWKYFKEQPFVPGGYFTTRHIANAWNRVVLSGENVRESLEQAVKDINKELEAKQKEFGVSP
ncbi:ABC-type glycerol-3-phosphate transport system, substrate-binding protein [Paenibacillus sp. yr247]|uniref:extracellular solute-binding protein n=1 Tax=Paenibacillus sp. yr247 TaxID=1761880 RepID=UPI0008866CFD|nr:extracellular solute-binding protein [Paenibacillus sp. yr247]SDO42896.1 ABC-type glycerol-3-phosphate transport system, substrate-binding protein [Paenibacillus sp. yr247]